MLKGIVLLAFLVLVESIQAVIIYGLISSMVAYGVAPVNADLFAKYKDTLKPEREMLIYHLFIVTALAGQAGAVAIFRGGLGEREFQRALKALINVDAGWVLLQLFAVFKILVYGNPWWARAILYGGLAGSLLTKVFWGECKIGLGQALSWLGQGKSAPKEIRLEGETTGLYWWRPLGVLVMAIQAVIGLQFLLARTPALSPALLYGVFLIVALGMVAYGMGKGQSPQPVLTQAGQSPQPVLTQAGQARRLKPAFVLTEALLTILLLCAWFKLIVFDRRPQIASSALYVLMALAFLNKIFWPHISKAATTIYVFLFLPRNRAALKAGGDVCVIMLIAAIIYVPDLEAVLAKMFVGEQFHHMNRFLMAPGWAHVCGQTLNVEVISRYGIGVPIVLSTIAQWLGGFNYFHMLQVVMGICLVYHMAWYVFLRLWLKSFLLSAAAILVGIKLQMFYTMSLPQPLTYASGSPVRCVLDIVFMILVWRHLVTGRWMYLGATALTCAAAIFYMAETGGYLTFSFYAYLFLHSLIPRLRRRLFGSWQRGAMAGLCAVSIPVLGFVFFCLAVGQNAWTAQFWANNFEFARYYTGGLIMSAFYESLPYGQFWDLLGGFLFPAVYALTILIVGTLCVFGRLPFRHVMVVVLCVYGLGAHNYYVALTIANNYYMRAMPFVCVVFYWARWGQMVLPASIRRPASLALLAFCAYALWTNHHFLSYPNRLNFSRNPMLDPAVAETLPDGRTYLNHKVRDIPEHMKLAVNSLGEKDEGLKSEGDFDSDEELKSYYKKEILFTEDAQLIRSLTQPKQAVALISSFEMEILQQADRRPLFYYFSLFFSRPMRMRNFGTVEIFTKGQLRRLTDQLEQGPVPVVFMERIFLEPTVPARYTYENPALMGLLAHVNNHYQAVAYGKYLVALKRRF